MPGGQVALGVSDLAMAIAMLYHSWTASFFKKKKKRKNAVVRFDQLTTSRRRGTSLLRQVQMAHLLADPH